jgi:two-component system copper resistance phosphate regulon response regulator CusR
MRILVVEDELKVAAALKRGLELEGYEVDVAPTGEDGHFRAAETAYDLAIFDVRLPGRSGIDVLRAIRARGVATPVILLTARDAVDERVGGLDAGADDYVVKPFAFPELVARIRALLRRGRPDQALRLRVGDVEMDLVTRRVTRGAREVHLTAREYDLLQYLMRNRARLVSREMLAQDVWRETARATPLDNVIDVHMMRLRRKVDADVDARLIHTVRGVGFVLQETPP